MKSIKLAAAAALMPLLCLQSLPGVADDAVLDDVGMDVVAAQEGMDRPDLQRPREIIRDYMLDNGDLTQEDIDARQEARQALREELKALREAGDEEALQAKRDELRALREERREQVRAYVEENDELRTALEEARAENREARQQIRERIRERRQNMRDARDSAES